MRYYAKVTIKTAKGELKQGSRIPDSFPEKDKKNLIKRGFVQCVEDDEETEERDPLQGEGFNMRMEAAPISVESLNKIRRKAELVSYGETLGLQLSEEMSKQDLISEILNRFEESGQDC